MEKLLFFAIRVYCQIEFLLLKLIPSKKENSVLIMRLDAIGDMIIWLDSAKEFKKHFPTKRLVLLCNAVCSEIAKHLPYFDEVVMIDKNKFLRNFYYRFKILGNLKKRTFDQIVNTVFSRDFFVQDTLIHNLQAPIKVGYRGDYQITGITLAGVGIKHEKYTYLLENLANKWYAVLLNASEQPLMELNRNADFIRQYIDPSFQSQLPVIPFQIPVCDQKPNRDYIVLFLGASTLRKVWKMANYAEITQKINPCYAIVLCGGKEDEPHYDEFMIFYSGSSMVKNLIGKTTLIELFSIIQHAKFIITNDTSASHIAVAVRTPSVCLMGGAHYGRFQPYAVESINEEEMNYLPKVANCFMDCYGCNHICRFIPDKKTTYPCIAHISPQLVLEKINELERDLQPIS